jgi:hypothetical protein
MARSRMTQSGYTHPFNIEAMIVSRPSQTRVEQRSLTRSELRRTVSGTQRRIGVTTRFQAKCVANLRLRLSAKAWDFRPRTVHSSAVSCWVVRLGTPVRKMICKVFRQDACGAVDVIRDYSSVVRGFWCQMPINSCCIDCRWLIVNGFVF